MIFSPTTPPGASLLVVAALLLLSSEGAQALAEHDAAPPGLDPGGGVGAPLQLLGLALLLDLVGFEVVHLLLATVVLRKKFVFERWQFTRTIFFNSTGNFYNTVFFCEIVKKLEICQK